MSKISVRFYKDHKVWRSGARMRITCASQCWTSGKKRMTDVRGLEYDRQERLSLSLLISMGKSEGRVRHLRFKVLRRAKRQRKGVTTPLFKGELH